MPWSMPRAEIVLPACKHASTLLEQPGTVQIPLTKCLSKQTIKHLLQSSSQAGLQKQARRSILEAVCRHTRALQAAENLLKDREEQLQEAALAAATAQLHRDRLRHQAKLASVKVQFQNANNVCNPCDDDQTPFL